MGGKRARGLSEPVATRSDGPALESSTSAACRRKRMPDFGTRPETQPCPASRELWARSIVRDRLIRGVLGVVTSVMIVRHTPLLPIQAGRRATTVRHALARR